MLEKIYARVFDLSTAQKGKVPELTEEGQLLIQKAKVNAHDLIPRPLEDFMKKDQTVPLPSSPRAKMVSQPEPSLFTGMTIGSGLGISGKKALGQSVLSDAGNADEGLTKEHKHNEL